MESLNEEAEESDSLAPSSPQFDGHTASEVAVWLVLRFCPEGFLMPGGLKDTDAMQGSVRKYIYTQPAAGCFDFIITSTE